MKKRAVSDEPMDNVNYCSAIATKSLVQQKADPGAFTIPYTIGSLNFAKALCDLGVSINLMLLDVYKKLGLGDPTSTNIWLVMGNRSVKTTVEILHDVLVKVANFVLPANFVVLDYQADFEVPIILGRPFLIIGRVVVAMKLNEIKFRFNDKGECFKLHSSMIQQKDMSVFSITDIFYEDRKEVAA
ncbi:uncharacterized protein LOC124892121 [Capsicum annuum]|uniref:uncharacterized protein LOC124892121 n=1 Tax=Capsicum annuum TaxID=4072 RepID=UPI001FB07247|nr:uncharacterized protein LOC124892121 [Capsicum annuum]